MATTRKTTKKTAGRRSAGRARSGAAADAAAAPRSLSDTAQQIWLAGVGAFGRAQAEGTRLFDSLARDGADLEKTARDFAAARASEVRGVFEQGVTQTRDRALEGWEQLESMVETRVHGALQKWGVPRRSEVDALRAEIDALRSELRARAEGSGGRTAKASKRASGSGRASAPTNTRSAAPGKASGARTAKPRATSRTTPG